MIKKIILYLTAMIMLALPVFGQFDGLKKAAEKTLEAGGKKTPNGKRDANEPVRDGAAINKKATLGSGVEAVLTTTEYDSFAEAKTNAVNQVTDGESLWLYVKFDESLAKYAYKSDITDDDGNLKYFLYVEIGALGGNAYDDAALVFKKDELNRSELKIALAPGRAGRNKSVGVSLNTVGGGSPGIWKNEIRIGNSPLSESVYLARVPLTAKVDNGIAKYRKMKDEYFQTVARGTADENSLPAATRYVNNALKNQIFDDLKNEGITPVKFYFTTDGWQEYTQDNVKQSRKIYAAYTYKKGAECLYGIAEVVQDYNQLTASYGAIAIYLRYDSPILCANLN